MSLKSEDSDFVYRMRVPGRIDFTVSGKIRALLPVGGGLVSTGAATSKRSKGVFIFEDVRFCGTWKCPESGLSRHAEIRSSESHSERPTTEGRSESKGPAGSSSGNLSKPGKNAPLGEMRDEKWLPPTVKEIPRFRFAPLGMTHC